MYKLTKEEATEILNSVKTGGSCNLFDYVEYANAVAKYVLNKNDDWLPMETAPKDGTVIQLLVDFQCHSMADAVGPHPTIGSNISENVTEACDWQFAGWDWEYDCYTEGKGIPVGWKPFNKKF